MSTRSTLHSGKAPLPVKNGIDPVALILPKLGDTPEAAYQAQPRRPHETYGTTTVLDYMVARFYPHDRATYLARFENREVLDDAGTPLSPTAPLAGQKIWYYRQLPQEPEVPTDIPTLYEDDHIIAIDKPHFLNTAPNGRFVANTALTLLRVRENNPLLTPVHRLDRLTAGVLIFAKTKEARAPFQTLFEQRKISKTYEAIAAPITGLHPGDTLEITTRITQQHGTRRITQLSPEEATAQGLTTNAHTRITCLSATTHHAHYLLQPTTGKTPHHQK